MTASSGRWRRAGRGLASRAACAALIVVTLGLLAVTTGVGASGWDDADAVLEPPILSRPAVGALMDDPVFGSRLLRVSGGSDEGGFETPIYSQLQAFDASGSYLLTTGSAGYQVRRTDDLSIVPGLDLAEVNVPRWHPAEPGVLLHFDTHADDDLTLQTTHVEGARTEDLADLAGYSRLLNDHSFDELSRDGRWLAGLAVRTDGEAVLFSFDLAARALAAELPIGELYAGPCAPDPTWGQVLPDWLAPSPLGRYLVVQWGRDGTERCSGLEALDISSGAFVGRIYDGHAHGDLGITHDGREFFMTWEIYHPSGSAYLGYRWLPGPAAGATEPDYLVPIDWGSAGQHISCQGPPGVCLVTAGTDEANDWQALEGELFLLALDGSVRRLAHHRSSSCGYWSQPRATISRDGRLALFASDWGERPCRDSELGSPDPYLLSIAPERAPSP